MYSPAKRHSPDRISSCVSQPNVENVVNDPSRPTVRKSRAVADRASRSWTSVRITPSAKQPATLATSVPVKSGYELPRATHRTTP